MPPQENTLLGLLTGGRYAQSSDLPTAKQIGSSAIDSIIDADNKRKSKVLFESGKNIFGKPTDKFTQGDLDNLIIGVVGSASMIPPGSKKISQILKEMSERGKQSSSISKSVKQLSDKSGKQPDISIGKLSNLLQSIKNKNPRLYDDIEAFAPREAVEFSPDVASSLLSQKAFRENLSGSVGKKLSKEMLELSEASAAESLNMKTLSNLLKLYNQSGFSPFYKTVKDIKSPIK